MAADTIKQARWRVNNARTLLNRAYNEESPFSLAGERARELLGECSTWLEEYEEEVRDSEREQSEGAGGTGASD